jgi:ribosomal protein L29
MNTTEINTKIAELKARQLTERGTDAWDATQAEIVALEDLRYDIAGSHTWNTSRCQ